VVLEACAWPSIDYENPLAAMARAEQTSKTMRFVEVLTGMANASKDGAIMDWLDEDAAMPGVADEIGVPPVYVRTPQAVAALRQTRSAGQQASDGSQALLNGANAFKAIAQGNQIGAGA